MDLQLGNGASKPQVLDKTTAVHDLSVTYRRSVLLTHTAVLVREERLPEQEPRTRCPRYGPSNEGNSAERSGSRGVGRGLEFGHSKHGVPYYP